MSKVTKKSVAGAVAATAVALGLLTVWCHFSIRLGWEESTSAAISSMASPADAQAPGTPDAQTQTSVPAAQEPSSQLASTTPTTQDGGAAQEPTALTGQDGVLSALGTAASLRWWASSPLTGGIPEPSFNPGVYLSCETSTTEYYMVGYDNVGPTSVTAYIGDLVRAGLTTISRVEGDYGELYIGLTADGTRYVSVGAATENSPTIYVYPAA